METIRYAVLAVGAEWRVVSARRQIGHFATRGLAVEAALRFAQEAARSGCCVEILYADQGGELHAFHVPALMLSPPPVAPDVPTPQQQPEAWRASA
jgi:hypothetical protein